ncbi:pre-toxin TG domain-containing protein, partial [Bacillus thuringiensis]|uniref:pre-toxin TG domain-containing protein n=1 Tax=Bacillus thuringiensis TaxID=1428 RepID=UPI0036E32709
GFKNRLPEYKQMASDLRLVNQSFHKFGDSVQKTGASLHKQAVMADGLINSVSTHVAEAQQAFPTLHTDIMSGLDAANNMMDSDNKIASYKIDVPAASKNIGNIDLSNALCDLGGDPSRVYDCKNDGDLSFVLGITPIIGTGKEIGQLIKGEDLVTGQKYGPEDYAWGTLAVVSGGTTRVVGKVFGKVADLEKKGKALEAAAKNTKHEVKILGRGSTGRTTANTLEERLAIIQTRL